MKKLLLLGSVVSACPPLKQGGTERVAYYQAKHLALYGVNMIFIGAKGTIKNFSEQLQIENADVDKIISKIEFIEIGGGTQFGNAQDKNIDDKSLSEASRNLRLEMVHLAQVQELMSDRKKDYSLILNNMRGEAILIPLASELQKRFINVMHLNIFEDLATIFKKYNTDIITIATHQKEAYPQLNHLATIANPVATSSFTFNKNPKNYALMLSTIGEHKNQKDAILACQKAEIPLIISGKVRDQKYFENEIKPYIDNGLIQFYGEMDFKKKFQVYASARVFLFPIIWQEPFGLVVIEALASGTPVIAYPHGGPVDIITNGKNGFLVNNVEEMADKIKMIDSIDRQFCRDDVVLRFDEKIIGEQYSRILQRFL